jgi:hypothetical protein
VTTAPGPAPTDVRTSELRRGQGPCRLNPEQTISHRPRSLRATQPSARERACPTTCRMNIHAPAGRSLIRPSGKQTPDHLLDRSAWPDPNDPEHMILSGHHRAAAPAGQLAHIRVEGVGWTTLT